MFIGTKDQGVKPKMDINGRMGEGEKGRRGEKSGNTIRR